MDNQNNSGTTNNPVNVYPIEPKTEEECPGIFSEGFTVDTATATKDLSRRPPHPIVTEDIETQKYRSAISITGCCIRLVIVVWLIDIVASGLSFTINGFTFEFDTAHTTTVIDLLKYVITASLSFFFGTTVSNKDKS